MLLAGSALADQELDANADNYIDDTLLAPSITRDSELVGANETYGSGWNSDTSLPEKDDIYDYLHVIDTDDEDVSIPINNNIGVVIPASLAMVLMLNIINSTNNAKI